MLDHHLLQCCWQAGDSSTAVGIYTDEDALVIEAELGENPTVLPTRFGEMTNVLPLGELLTFNPALHVSQNFILLLGLSERFRG